MRYPWLSRLGSLNYKISHSAPQFSGQSGSQRVPHSRFVLEAGKMSLTEFRHVLRSPKFIWFQFAWALWTNIRHVAILRIPWCIVSSFVKLIVYGRWESPIVRTSKGRHLAIIGKREYKDYVVRDKAEEHPELVDGDDCQEVAKDTYKMGIYKMTFVCDGKCVEKVKQVCLHGTSKDKDPYSWFYEEKESKDPSVPRFCGKVEGFYELTTEIVSGVYIVDEIPQREFLRRIVESKGRSDLDSTDWWVTGYHKPDELIFRSRWSILKTDSRLYTALPIVPIFLNSQFSKEWASIAFIFLVLIDLLLPLTSTILNLLRYVAKTRLQILVSRIDNVRSRQLIFDILTGFRPGMKPCLDKDHKVVRLKSMHIIVFPKENPICYPFHCGDCFTPRASELRSSEWKLADGTIIRYWRKESRPTYEDFLRSQEALTRKESDSVTKQDENLKKIKTTAVMHVGVANDVTLDLPDEGEANSKQVDHKIDVDLEKELEGEKKRSEHDEDPQWKNVKGEDDVEDITLVVKNSKGTTVWEGVKLQYTKQQRSVLEFYLENMDNTFSVEACNSRFWGRECCVQPKNLFDTLDDIRFNSQCLLVHAKGNFLVGPTIPNRNRLYRL